MPLLDSGAADGLLYYVMPYVRGETLRARLDRERQLPVDDALRIAREVAGALEHAHRQGIIHRDIKPENILLQDGAAVVADFGIALAVQTAGGARLTQTGLSLGTPQYMSPEQAMGERTIDARTDIYALGAVTYEMLAGEPPFTGASTQAIVAKVLTERPTSLRAVRDTVPEPVERAVLQALAKLPADRPLSAAHFARRLEESSTNAASSNYATAQRVTRRGRLVSGLVGLCVGIIGIASAFFVGQRSASASPSASQIVLWKQAFAPLLSPGAQVVASQGVMAPDGSSIVFADSLGGRLQLFRKLRGETHATPIPGTDNAVSPFFSPDGASIGFLTTDGKLRRMAIAGGAPVTLYDMGSTNFAFRAAAWLEDNTIVFSSGEFALGRIPAGGGALQTLRMPVRLRWTQINAVRGTSNLLVLGCMGGCSSTRSSVYAYDVATNRTWVVRNDVLGAWYAPSGHLLWGTREGVLMASRASATTLKPEGEPIAALDGVEFGTFSFSTKGDLLYAALSGSESNRQLVWVNRQGVVAPVDSTWHAHFEYPALSPDGRSLAVSIMGSGAELWLRSGDGARRQVGQKRQLQWRPFWEADGHSLLFAASAATDTLSDSLNATELLRTDVATQGMLQTVLRGNTGVYEGETTPDGEWLVYRADEFKTGSNILARRLRGDSSRVEVSTTAANEVQVALSPDGTRLAFASNESGQHEVYVMEFPSLRGRVKVSNGGALEPRWSRDSRELFFVSGGSLKSALIAPSPIAVGEIRTLFPVKGFVRARNRAEYDVHVDGQRFLMIKVAPSTGVAPAVLIQDWFDMLRERVP